MLDVALTPCSWKGCRTRNTANHNGAFRCCACAPADVLFSLSLSGDIVSTVLMLKMVQTWSTIATAEARGHCRVHPDEQAHVKVEGGTLQAGEAQREHPAAGETQSCRLQSCPRFPFTSCDKGIGESHMTCFVIGWRRHLQAE